MSHKIKILAEDQYSQLLSAKSNIGEEKITLFMSSLLPNLFYSASDKILGYEEEPFAIFDKQVLQLRSKRISAVKVQWRGQPVEEATWEAEENMRSRYPDLFNTSGIILNPFEDERLFKRWRM